MNILYFDTETTGLPKASKPFDHPEQPHITQLGLILEVDGHDALQIDTLIKPDNWPIQQDSGTGIGKIASDITGITQDMCEKDGIPIADAMELFIIAAENADAIVCHNSAFDTKLIGFEYVRLKPGNSHRLPLCGRPILCTMLASMNICKLSKGDNRTDYKWPKLIEAMDFFFGEDLENAHSAIVDILATRRVFHKLGSIGAMDAPMEKVGLDPTTMNWRDYQTKAEKRAKLIEAVMSSDFCVDYDPNVHEAEALIDLMIADKLL